MENSRLFHRLLIRRHLLGEAGAAGVAIAAGPALAATSVNLPFPGGVGDRPITTAFPQKGAMVLQRTRPPLLETPFDVYDEGVFTPNDRFFVRWHWAVIPSQINVDTFRIKVHGAVNKEISLSLNELEKMPQIEYAAVNQCSGNSRGFSSRALRAANGAMARWAMRAGRACGYRTCSTARA